MVGYESEDEQISSDSKYLHFYNMFNHFGTCTNIILQVFVDLEVLKSTRRGEARDNPNPFPVARQGVGTYYGMQSIAFACLC